jgi:hypothetical protein
MQADVMRLSESETSRNTGRHETTSLVKWFSAAKLAENVFGCEQTGRRSAKRRHDAAPDGSHHDNLKRKSP